MMRKQQQLLTTECICSCAVLMYCFIMLFLQEGQHEDADCGRRIFVVGSGTRSVQVQPGLDCSGTAPPPNSYALGSHAEAQHLQLRETLANHLHQQHLEHVQRQRTRASGIVEAV
jgi:hypothetical protein